MKKTIFVVDDSDTSLTEAQNMLSEHYRVFTLPSAVKLFAMLEKLVPDLILLDIEMPEMRGYEAITKIKENPAWAEIPIIVMTGYAQEKITAFCVQQGALDFVHKPFTQAVLLKRLENYLNMDELIKKSKAKDAQIPNHRVFESGILSFISTYIERVSADHIKRIQKYTQLLVSSLITHNVYIKVLGSWDMETVMYAVVFHDIGKIAKLRASEKYSDSVEDEYARSLTTESKRIIKAIISDVGDSKLWNMALMFAGLRYENWDGSGFPNSLSSESIPLEGRIFAVVDTYERLTSGSAYQADARHDKAVETIKDGSGIRFDPKIVEVFIKCENIFREALLLDR